MSAQKSNIVEINGRKYDAQTGLPVTTAPAKMPATSKPKPPARPSIDGFHVKQKAAPKAAPAPAAPAKRPVSERSKTVSKHVHAGPKKSQTLKRDVVSKPKLASSDAKPVHHHQKRAERAKHTAKSPAISRFPKHTVNTEFAAAPAAKPTAHKPHTTAVAHAPAAAPVAHASQTPKELKNHLITQAMADATTTTGKVVKEKKRRISKFFAKRPRAMSIALSATAFLLLAGYITYLNIPNLSLRVAANKAGFDAKMPGYNPSGFAFSGPVAYSPGQITVAFKSNTDNREYQITQKETNWDSQSLLDNFVTDETQLYQTYQEKGLTIYVYDGSNAAWVSGGIWYTINGDSQLNTEQLIKIASSL